VKLKVGGTNPEYKFFFIALAYGNEIVVVEISD